MIRACPTDYCVLVIAMIVACVGLRMVLPNGEWIMAEALSVNGAFCMAHGASHIRSRHLVWGFVFTLIGGFQIGLVTSAIIEA